MPTRKPIKLISKDEFDNLNYYGKIRYIESLPDCLDIICPACGHTYGSHAGLRCRVLGDNGFEILADSYFRLPPRYFSSLEPANPNRAFAFKKRLLERGRS